MPAMATESTRRGFVAALGAGVTALGAGGSAAAQTPAAPHSTFAPARHADDDWYEEIPGKHRMIIDAATPMGAGAAILYASNLYASNRSAYGLAEGDLAIIICMRHFATPFAFTDAVWSKYGKALGAAIDFKDPKSKEPPATNLYNASGYAMALPNMGATLDAVLKRGARIAICDMASRMMAGVLARSTGSAADAILADFKANIVANSRFVAAGVLAVNRAQERGYTLIYAG